MDIEDLLQHGSLTQVRLAGVEHGRCVTYYLPLPPFGTPIDPARPGRGSIATPYDRARGFMVRAIAAEAASHRAAAYQRRIALVAQRPDKEQARAAFMLGVNDGLNEEAGRRNYDFVAALRLCSECHRYQLARANLHTETSSEAAPSPRAVDPAVRRGAAKAHGHVYMGIAAGADVISSRVPITCDACRRPRMGRHYAYAPIPDRPRRHR